MPLCARCSAPFVCTCATKPVKLLGDVAAPCPMTQDGAIWVHVVDDRGIDVLDVATLKDGEPKSTGDGGTAVFDPVPPGPHTVALAPLRAELLEVYEKLSVETSRAVTVASGQIAYVPYQLSRKPALSVKVMQKGGAKVFGAAVVTVTGPQACSGPTLDSGVIDFGRVTAGDYEIKVKLSDTDATGFATTLDFAKAPLKLPLRPGEERMVTVEVEPINVVEPKLELEYKIVLLDNKLHEKQTAGETKIRTSTTCIRASLSQSNPEHPFKKAGKLEITPAHVEVFTDEACEDKHKLVGDLTAEQLIGTPEQLMANKPPKLYLRGKTEGKFTVKLTLSDPEDRFIKLDNNPTPVEQMGVVKLELKLHQQDLAKLKDSAMQVDPDTDPESAYHTALKDKAIPDQKLMTAEEKIGEAVTGDAAKPGRLLHVQDGGHFGRAKLIIAKIDSNHLPPGTDDYDIVLEVGRGSSPDSEGLKTLDLQGGDKDAARSGAIELFDAEIDGAKKEKPKFKISVLKAGDQTLWVEGKSETDRPCDLRLDAGMDRAEGGLEKTVKRNGDWTRYTVVKIKEVKLDYVAPSTGPNQWDASEKEFFVNLVTGAEARKVKIEATLTKALKNVRLHFMLAPHKDNRKAANWVKDMPTTWKWKDVDAAIKHLDKTDRKDFLHLSEVTADDGKATKKLDLSRIGGDQFTPGCYLEQDPHLAKYVDGHTDLEKRKPVLATDVIKVSRKFWHELIQVPGVNNPGVAGTVAKFEKVKARLAAAPPLVVSPPPAGSVYPQYMVQLNGSTANALVVSDVNKTSFFNGVAAAADKPVKVPILICDAQWDVGGTATAGDTGWIAAANTVDLTTDLLVLKPPLDGGSLCIAGYVACCAPDSSDPSGFVNGPSASLTDANLTINPSRTNLNDVTVNLPATVQSFVDTHPGSFISISGLQVKGALGPYLGESFDKKILAVYETATADGPGLFQFTVCHELGHSFTQVMRDGVQPTGIPRHPHQYLSYSQGRCTGSHCNHGTNICVMFESAPNPGSLETFCDDCQPYMLVTDMSTLA